MKSYYWWGIAYKYEGRLIESNAAVLAESEEIVATAFIECIVVSVCMMPNQCRHENYRAILALPSYGTAAHAILSWRRLRINTQNIVGVTSLRRSIFPMRRKIDVMLSASIIENGIGTT